jgi:hypothetical protein
MKASFRIFFFIVIILLNENFAIAKDYNISEFGAVADGVTLNTAFIQEAFDQAHADGGGRVIIPAGVFLTGSLHFRSNVELHLHESAVLLGSPDPMMYDEIKVTPYKGFLMAENVNNIAITGPGTIDGQGRKVALHLDSLFYAGQLDSLFYNLVERRPNWRVRPYLIVFMDCNDVSVSGVSMKNSAYWVQQYERCNNVVIDNIRVDSDAYWNNDGIDITDCKNVRVTNSIINSADDGICLKSHSRSHFCDSIYIADCTVRSSASAIKFGTKSKGGFKNVIIENIKVYDTFRSAIAIESVDGGFLENIVIDGITATNTGNAIFIKLGNREKNFPTSSLRNVTLKNINVQIAFKRPDYAYEIRGPELPFFHNTFPASITGLPDSPVENISLENIVITYPGRGNNGLAHLPLSRLDAIPENGDHYPEFSMFGELPAWGLYVRHVRGLKMKNINISIEAPDYRRAIVMDDVQKLELKNIEVSGDDKLNPIVLYKCSSVTADEKELLYKMK